MSTDIPSSGVPGNWPTAGAIDNRIRMSGESNGGASPLNGMGGAFIEFGNKYGINPGFVCALLQRESQLGTDGSILPTYCNNYGGNTWGSNTGYPKCAAGSGIANREWNKYPTPREGLEGVFKNLDGNQYRKTGGKLIDVMHVYAPPFENDYADIMMIFGAVASNLGITLTEETNVYTNAGTSPQPLSTGSGGSGIAGGIQAIGTWATKALSEGIFRFVLIGIGIVGLYLGGRSLLNG